jgi:basic amino acid/polyamine antiporter, APA family
MASDASVASTPQTQEAPKTKPKLKKALGLFDVYAICTGAMFSSGFFLLPGLAAAQTGPSVALAYLIAGILMLPAMFSVAELATAMPRAGGAYYFLDRAMGPAIGTIGGIGTYLSLSLKSAFALIGMGAYLALFIDIPIQPLAIALTLAFTVLNLIGAKETTGLQRVLVTTLVLILAVFIVAGLLTVFQSDITTTVQTQFNPFMTGGIAGLLGTVGFVFVSYAGLTKIASVSEEVVNPGRNIPLGMMLSIISTTIIYVVGIVIMTAVLDGDIFLSSLTPVADAAVEVMSFLPGELGVLLVVAAAVAAFASTGNAGIMASSRYPMAMGRDHLLPAFFARLTKKGTPSIAIYATAGLMIFAILLLDESAIAKVASTVQLILFMLLNVAVIVMRESRIEYYDPVYRSPLYPWMQFAGILASIFLISYIGSEALVLTLGVLVLSGLWYVYYASKRVERHGAVYHWFSRLGESRYEGLEHELREILKEKGLRDEDPFEEVISRAFVIEAKAGMSFDDIAREATQLLSTRQPCLTEEHAAQFIDTIASNFTLLKYGVTLPSLRVDVCTNAEIVIVRSHEGVLIDYDADDTTEPARVNAFFFLVSPADDAGRHLRLLAEIARRVEDANFRHDWLHAEGKQELREILLYDDRIMTLWLEHGHRTEPLIGQRVRDISWPGGTLVALIRRDGEDIIPQGSAVMQQGDRLTIIGDANHIQTLYAQYVGDKAT